MIKSIRPVSVALAVGLFAHATPASAAYVVNVDESGGNVVATGGGSLNLSALTYVDLMITFAFIEPIRSAIGVSAGSSHVYEGDIEGPTSFGTFIHLMASSNSGGIVVMNQSHSRIWVPSNYVMGSDLGTSTGTWNGQTFASLGLTHGTYVWTWGSGDNVDSFTINIGSAVPEPGTWAMMLLGFGAIGGAMRVRRRRQKAAVSYA